MASRVVDVDKRYRKIVKAIGGLDDVSAVVGIRQEKGGERYHGEGPPGARHAVAGGLTLAEIATVLEFGAPSVGIPERPYLRDTFDLNAARYEEILTLGIKEATKPANLEHFDAELRKVIEITAIAAVGDVQEAIATPGAFAPNAPLTIAIKGSSVPLIDTGRLRQSIDYEVVDGPAPREGKAR